MNVNVNNHLTIGRKEAARAVGSAGVGRGQGMLPRCYDTIQGALVLHCPRSVHTRYQGIDYDRKHWNHLRPPVFFFSCRTFFAFLPYELRTFPLIHNLATGRYELIGTLS